MELTNEFRVPVSADKAWEVLTDVERIAPCMPGAQLLSVDGDEFTGTVKVKVGPITVQYKGKAEFQQKDAAARRAVIKANGKETRGQGNASAVVTAELKDEGDTTSCVLTTDLTISGKAAQFGRGVLADVASKLIGQFADCLESKVESDKPTGTTEASTATTQAPAEAASQPAPATSQPSAPKHQADDAGSLDLLAVVALPLAKRAAPVAAGLAAGVVIGWLVGRRKNGGTE